MGTYPIRGTPVSRFAESALRALPDLRLYQDGDPRLLVDSLRAEEQERSKRRCIRQDQIDTLRAERARRKSVDLMAEGGRRNRRRAPWSLASFTVLAYLPARSRLTGCLD